MISNFPLNSNDHISQIFLDLGILNFQGACEYVQALPYKRNSRNEPLLVLEEGCGTCSMKHALLALLAEENNFQDIKLTIGIYKMSPKNTPGLGEVFPSSLEFIPEAHCYLSYRNQRLDYTRPGSHPPNDEDLLEEWEISADKIGIQKERMHKDYLKKWINIHNPHMSLEDLWGLREACIAQLSENS